MGYIIAGYISGVSVTINPQLRQGETAKFNGGTMGENHKSLPLGLPVISTGTELLDHHHNFYKQKTSRGDIIYVRESMGELREIAIVPIDAKPFLRWQEVDAKLQPLLDKELPGWEPTRPVRNDDWIRYDELNWAKEIDALLDRVLAWYMENAGREAVMR